MLPPAHWRVSPLTGNVVLRPAQFREVESLVALSTGPIAGKRAFIAESFERRSVVSAYLADEVVGYAVWDRGFFGRPFSWLVGVDPAYRRRGIAGLLLGRFLETWPTQAHFTSTNESNAIMQNVLGRAGFIRSGRVDNLDPGDPELFYYHAPREPVAP